MRHVTEINPVMRKGLCYCVRWWNDKQTNRHAKNKKRHLYLYI